MIIKSLDFNSFKILNKSRKKFINNVLISFLNTKCRISFIKLERFGEYSECTYRSHFEEKLDFFEFNRHLVKQISDEIIIGFDPSYLSKSGKKTYGVGYFWSGVASNVKWGMEVAEFAVIDPKLNTVFHLNAYQTLPK